MTSTPPETSEGRSNGPRSRKGAHTRARLVEAAKAVFEDDGFLDARITDIAERAGLSHGSFYHYFDSKDAVFLEVAEMQEQRFSQGSITGTGLLDGTGGTSVHQQVTDSLRRYLDLYRSEARIMGVIEQVSRYHEPVRRIRAEQQHRYHEQLERSIAELQRRGVADPDLAPAIVAPALVAMITRFAELWFAQGRLDCPFEEGVEQLTTLCLNTLGVRAAER